MMYEKRNDEKREKWHETRRNANERLCTCNMRTHVRLWPKQNRQLKIKWHCPQRKKNKIIYNMDYCLTYSLLSLPILHNKKILCCVFFLFLWLYCNAMYAITRIYFHIGLEHWKCKECSLFIRVKIFCHNERQKGVTNQVHSPNA